MSKQNVVTGWDIYRQELYGLLYVVLVPGALAGCYIPNLHGLGFGIFVSTIISTIAVGLCSGTSFIYKTTDSTRERDIRINDILESRNKTCNSCRSVEVKNEKLLTEVNDLKDTIIQLKV